MAKYKYNVNAREYNVNRDIMAKYKYNVNAREYNVNRDIMSMPVKGSNETALA